MIYIIADLLDSLDLQSWKSAKSLSERWKYVTNHHQELAIEKDDEILCWTS